MLVLVADMPICLAARGAAVAALIAATPAYLLLDATEAAWRWGLWRVDGWTAPPAPLMRQYAGCADPPCAQGPGGLFAFAAAAVVFVMDAFITMTFATGLHKAADVTVSVATALASYDLGTAEAALHTAEAAGLPEELRA
eukprot:gene7746-4317_t